MNKTKKIISKIISILLVVFIAVPLIPFQAKAASYDTNVTFSGGHGSYTDLNGEGLAFFSGEDVTTIVVMYNNATVPNDTYDVKYSYYIHSDNTQGDLGETAPTGKGYYSVIAEVKDKSTGGTVAVNRCFFHIMDKPNYTIYFKDDTNSLGSVSVTWGGVISGEKVPQPKKEGYRLVGWYEAGENENLVDLSKPYEPVPIGDLGTAHAAEYYAKWSKLTKVDKVDPTCTEDGTAEYWEDAEGNIFADAYGQEELDMPEVIEATGHKWDEPVYSWSIDETEVTASRKCLNDASHVETETVKTEIVVVTEPTDTEDGILQVIATFKNSAFEKQVREYSYNNEGTDGKYILISELTEWIKGGKDPLSLRFKSRIDDEKTFDKFLGIEVDGKEVSEENYTKEKGSVIVNLKPEFLETLNVGEHTIEAMFEDGSVKAIFTIKEAKDTEVKPAEAKKEAAKSNATKTGDSSPLLIAIIVMAVSALAIVTMIVVKKKKKN